VIAVLRSYAGPVAVMSFDPAPIAVVRRRAPGLTRGIVAERRKPEQASAARRLQYVANAISARPQFIAYNVDDLPAAGVTLARNLFGLSVLTWTVRTDAQRACALQHADQMIFEGFRA
jgi:glycerophosphoryl diester phosphodiesterase